jgi:hypothetical protein
VPAIEIACLVLSVVAAIVLGRSVALGAAVQALLLDCARLGGSFADEDRERCGMPPIAREHCKREGAPLAAPVRRAEGKM